MIDKWATNKKIWCRILLALTIMTLMSGCLLDRAGTRVPPTEFTVTPANICAGDPINLSWNIWTSEPCWAGRPVADLMRCSTINSPTSDNPEVPFNPGLDERSGSIDYDPGPSVDTTFNMTALILSREGSGSEPKSTSVNVIDVPTSIPLVAAGLCGDNAGIRLSSIISTCVEVNEICIGSDNPATGQYVLRGWRECLPGTPADVCSRPAFESAPLNISDCISPSDVSVRTFQGLSLIDIDWRQDPLTNPDPRPSNCEVEGSGFNDPLTVVLRTSCTNAYLGCED